MDQLPTYDSGFKGTLSSRRGFAYPSNQVGRNSFTNDAGSSNAVQIFPKKG